MVRHYLVCTRYRYHVGVRVRVNTIIPGGLVVNRTYGTHKKNYQVYISIFLLIICGPIYYNMVPRNNRNARRHVYLVSSYVASRRVTRGTGCKIKIESVYSCTISTTISTYQPTTYQVLLYAVRGNLACCAGNSLPLAYHAPSGCQFRANKMHHTTD